MRIGILPYGPSDSVNALRDSLNNLFAGSNPARRVLRENSIFRGRTGELLINWGNSSVATDYYDGLVGNATFFNHPECIKNASLKTRAMELFADNGVSHVESTTSAEQARLWIEEGHGVYARTQLQGHSGEGIVFCYSGAHERDDDIGNIDTCFLPSPDAPLPAAPLYTKAIAGPRREFRIHVCEGKVIFTQLKKRRNNYSNDPEINYSNVVRNYHTGWIYASAPRTSVPNDSAYQNAVAAVHTLGLDFGAVDVITNGDDAWVLEVNTAPGLGGISTLEAYTSAFYAISRSDEVNEVLPEAAVGFRERTLGATTVGTEHSVVAASEAVAGLTVSSGYAEVAEDIFPSTFDMPEDISPDAPAQSAPSANNPASRVPGRRLASLRVTQGDVVRCVQQGNIRNGAPLFREGELYTVMSSPSGMHVVSVTGASFSNPSARFVIEDTAASSFSIRRVYERPTSPLYSAVSTLLGATEACFQLDRALEAAGVLNLDHFRRITSYRLDNAFTWSDTPQGYDYWQKIATGLSGGQNINIRCPAIRPLDNDTTAGYTYPEYYGVFKDDIIRKSGVYDEAKASLGDEEAFFQLSRVLTNALWERDPSNWDSDVGLENAFAWDETSHGEEYWIAVEEAYWALNDDYVEEGEVGEYFNDIEEPSDSIVSQHLLRNGGYPICDPRRPPEAAMPTPRAPVPPVSTSSVTTTAPVAIPIDLSLVDGGLYSLTISNETFTGQFVASHNEFELVGYDLPVSVRDCVVGLELWLP